MKVLDVRKLTARRSGSAVPSTIVADSLMAFGEDLELFVPDPAVQEAIVEQHERVAFARDLVVQLGAVDPCRSGCRRHFTTSEVF
jgi:hypothetical protein